MQELIGADLTVIANTGDDIEALGVHVSPDPDLVTYWLGGRDRRGARLGDPRRQLHRLRAPRRSSARRTGSASPTATSPPASTARQFLAEGGRLTDAQAQIARAARRRGPGAADVRAAGPHPGARPAAAGAGLQEYLIVDRGEPEVEGVELEGIDERRADRRGAGGAARGRAIVIGPSNPVISIGPILAVPGMREAIAAAAAPVVAVSPFVAGKVVKGPTERFMAAVGRPSTAAGVASLYAGLIDAMVVDEGDPDPPPAEIPTLGRPRR